VCARARACVHAHTHVWHSHAVISNSVRLKSQLVMCFKINTPNQSLTQSTNQWEIYFNFTNKFSHRHRGTSVTGTTNPAYTCSGKTAQPEWKLLRQFKRNEMVPWNMQFIFTEMFNLKFTICTDYGDSECQCEQTKWTSQNPLFSTSVPAVW